MKVFTADDNWIEVDNGKIVSMLDALGVPRNVLVVDEKGARVLNPETGKHETGGSWSRERETLAAVRAIPAAGTTDAKAVVDLIAARLSN